MFVGGWIQDLTNLIDVLIWPLVVVFALWWAASRRGRSFLQPLLGRVRKVGAGGFSVELSEQNARVTRVTVQEGLAEYAEVLDMELDRLTHRHGVETALKAVVAKLKSRPEDWRATIHIRDPLVGDALHQLINYLADDSADAHGIHRRWSIRFGILGRSWRLQKNRYEPTVPKDEEQLIVEWGMTAEQAREAGKGRQSFLCRVLRAPDAQPAPVPVASPSREEAPGKTAQTLQGENFSPASRTPVGVLYLDAKRENAFGTERHNLSVLGDAEHELAWLETSVAAVVGEIRRLGPSIKLLDSD
jgi:hypothetical protein